MPALGEHRNPGGSLGRTMNTEYVFLQASQRTTEIKERKVLEWPAFQRKRTDFSTLEFNGKSKILVRFMENFMPEVSKESHVLNSLCMLKN